MIDYDKAKNAEEMFSLWQDYIERHPAMQSERRKLFYKQEESERFYPKFRQVFKNYNMRDKG